MNRWTFKEDYIVCKYCEEHKYQFVEWELLDEVLRILENEGFKQRSRSAVQKRTRYYLWLAFGQKVAYIPIQVQKIYDVFTGELYATGHREDLKAYITKKKANVHMGGELETFGQSTNNLEHMVHTAKGRRFIDVLEDLIKESRIVPKTSIYTDVGMKQDTFSAIRRGKYPTVSRENVFRICFGLRLNYDNATKLMKSCGMLLRDDLVMDAVVEYHLKKGPTKQKEKCKGTYIYDCELIDADLYESGANTLFSER